MNPAPLRWWSRTALDAAATAFEPAWQRWCMHWNVLPGSTTLAANTFDTPEAAWVQLRWQRLSGEAGAAAWLGTPHAALAQVLRKRMFGSAQAVPGPGGFSAGGSIAQEVAEAASHDLIDELDRVLPVDTTRHSEAAPPAAETSPSTHDRRPWSGAIDMQLGTGRADIPPIVVHLPPSTAELVMAAHAPKSEIRRQAPAELTPVSDAIGSKLIRLGVELVGVSLDLGMLQSLHPGDVLKLQHRLDEPLNVCLPHDSIAGGETKALCRALLGARAGRRAVELVREEIPA